MISVPEELRPYGIAGKRQFILEWAYKNNHNSVWQLDNQMVFCQNVGLHPTLQKGQQLLRFKSTEEMLPYIKNFKNKLDNYPMVGMLNRSGTYQTRISSEDVKIDIENTRIYASFIIDVNYFMENNIRFDLLSQKFNDPKLSLMEDYSVELQILSKGDKILQVGDWCFDKQSFSSGGCSSQRTIDTQKATIEALIKIFPQYCKLVEAKDETKKESVKYNIRISWSKFKEKKLASTLDEW